MFLLSAIFSFGRLAGLGNHAQELCIVIRSILVLRPDIDELLEAPSVTQSGHEVGQLVLVALEHPVHVFIVLSGTNCHLDISEPDPLLNQLNEMSDVVEFSLFQNTLLAYLLVHHQFAVSEVVQDRSEVVGVSVDHVRTGQVFQ